MKIIVLALVAALSMTACGTISEVREEIAEKGEAAIEERRKTADLELRFHLVSLCMANLDSLVRVLNERQLQAVRMLCSDNEEAYQILLEENEELLRLLPDEG